MNTTDKVIQVCETIQADLHADIHRYEGMEVNGRNLAMIHGEIMGTIAGLANAVKRHAESVSESQ